MSGEWEGLGLGGLAKNLIKIDFSNYFYVFKNVLVIIKGLVLMESGVEWGKVLMNALPRT